MKPNHYQKEILEQIGNRLFSIRHARREKITNVAKHVGVSHPVISRIENGRYKALSIDLLYKIAGHYQVNVEHLLTDELPPDILSDADIVSLLKEENRHLKERLAAFEFAGMREDQR